LAEDGKLDAVDGFELLQGQPQSHGGENVDLDQGLTAFVVGAESAVPGPLVREVGKFGVVETMVVLRPAILTEALDGGRYDTGAALLVGASLLATQWNAACRPWLASKLAPTDLGPEVGVMSRKAA
jgi:hypothetical protein